ncbi:MAG: PDZ domain-containing protein [Actinobacteria bacterium]|nr:MAG: PDZ domain-containing protein [Actinomycetota bacterium]
MLVFSFIRLLIAVAVLGILIVIHEFGHFIVAKLFNIKVTEFFLGLPGPKLWFFQRGETTYGVTSIPFGGYVKMVGSELGDEEVSKEDEPRSFLAAKFYKKVLVILAGPFMNLMLAFIVFALTLLSFKVIPYKITNKIGQVQAKNPAAIAGVKKDDTIIAVNNEPTKTWTKLKKEISSKPNQAINLNVRRDSKMLKIRVKTAVRDKKGFLGISPVALTRRASLGEAIKNSAQTIWEITYKTYEVIFRAITGRPGQLLTGSRGPIGIVREIARFAESIISLLFIFSVINVAVAIINLLPMPPLDFGRVVLLTFEKLKGSPLKKQTAIAVNGIGMALLLMLLAYVTYRDIARFF